MDADAQLQQAEADLKKANEEWERTFNAVPDLIAILDDQQRIVRTNRAMHEKLGMSSQELIGQKCFSCFHEAEHAPAICPYLHMLAEGKEYTEEIFVERVSRYYLVTATPLFNAAGKITGCVHVARDITERSLAEQAEHQQRQLAEALRDAGAALNSSLDLSEVLKQILKQTAVVVPHDAIHILLVDPHGQVTETYTGQSYPPELRAVWDKALKGANLSHTSGFKEVFESGQPLLIAETSAWPEEYLLPGLDWVHSHITAPLKIKGKIVGFLNLDSAIAGFFTQEHVNRLMAFANHAAVAVENARLYTQVSLLATMDELTGIYNYRGLMQLGQREFERSRRFKRPLSAFFIDIDYFKDFNDRFSHIIGNQVLRAVSQRITSAVREVDLVARFGGDEFVILLSETNLSQAEVIAERLRHDIEIALVLADTRSLGITVSIGVSQRMAEMQTLSDLIDRANRAEHRAKELGRNRVEIG